MLDYSKEIKDTFPSDYTQIQDDIGSLKEDLGKLSGEIGDYYEKQNLSLQIGTVKATSMLLLKLGVCAMSQEIGIVSVTTNIYVIVV